MADIEQVALRTIVINHGSVIYDAEVAAMRRTLLSTKLVEVGLSLAAGARDGRSCGGRVGKGAAPAGGVLPVGAVVATATAGGPPRPVALALAVPSVVLAIACNIVAQHAFAAAAFWLRDAGSAWFLYQKLVFVLGGMLIPLEALPGWLERTAAVLPFQAMSYTPARLASGHLEPALVLQQIGWLVVLAAGATALFRAGERRLQVVGG